jgi:hypothetical protein
MGIERFDFRRQIYGVMEWWSTGVLNVMDIVIRFFLKPSFAKH